MAGCKSCSMYCSSGIGIIHDDLTDRGDSDRSLAGILDAENGCVQSGFDLRALKGKIGIQHRAVDQFETLAVTKRLGADDRAVFKCHVLAIPCQVFALDHTVFYNDVSGMPEGILGIEIAVGKDGVRDVLEGIFALESDMVKVQMIGAHHEVFALIGAVLHRNAADGPAEFLRYDIAVFHRDIGAFPQCLDAVQLTVGDGDVFGIP